MADETPSPGPSAPGLRVTERYDGGACVLEAEGEIDLDTADALAGPLLRAAQNPAVSSLGVDLRRADFLDSAGLAALVQAVNALRGRGRRLHLAARPHGQPEHVLHLSGLARLTDVAPDPALWAPD